MFINIKKKNNKWAINIFNINETTSMVVCCFIQIDYRINELWFL